MIKRKIQLGLCLAFMGTLFARDFIYEQALQEMELIDKSKWHIQIKDDLESGKYPPTSCHLLMLLGETASCFEYFSHERRSIRYDEFFQEFIKNGWKNEEITKQELIDNIGLNSGMRDDWPTMSNFFDNKKSFKLWELLLIETGFADLYWYEDLLPKYGFRFSDVTYEWFEIFGNSMIEVEQHYNSKIQDGAYKNRLNIVSYETGVDAIVNYLGGVGDIWNVDDLLLYMQHHSANDEEIERDNPELYNRLNVLCLEDDFEYYFVYYVQIYNNYKRKLNYFYRHATPEIQAKVRQNYGQYLL